MSEETIQEIVKKGYDLHFHVGPDILPRKYDNLIDLIRAEQGQIKGIALKSHAFPPAAFLKSWTEKIKAGPRLLGSITLNHFTGGLNKSSVYAAKMLVGDQPLMVWFPTVHAQNHLRQNRSGYEIPPSWVKDPHFVSRPANQIKGIKILKEDETNLTEETVEILTEIKKHNCVLATGHLSAREAAVLAKAARQQNVTAIVTHARQRDINMPLEQQKELAALGVYIEHCYIMWLDRDNPEDYPLEETVAQIKAVGPEQCLLTSDAGQWRNPSSSQCLRAYLKLLSEHGLTENDFHQMLVANPQKILNLN